MSALVITSGFLRWGKGALVLLLIAGAIDHSARPILTDERQLRLAEVPTLLLGSGQAIRGETT